MARKTTQLMVEEATKRPEMRFMVERSMAVYETKSQALKAYKASMDFEGEVIDNATSASSWASIFVRPKWLDSIPESI